MAKVLTRAQIEQARDAVDDYRKACDSHYSNLESTLGSLMSSNWNGDGSDGCKYFFDGVVTNALTEGITGITQALIDILTNVEATFLDGLDPQLGDANRSAGSGS